MTTQTPTPPVRMGRFTLPLDVLFNDPETALRIMSRMLVFRAEVLVHLGPPVVNYIANSELFLPIEAGTIPPEYIIELTDDSVSARLVIAK